MGQGHGVSSLQLYDTMESLSSLIIAFIVKYLKCLCNLSRYLLVTEYKGRYYIMPIRGAIHIAVIYTILSTSLRDIYVTLDRGFRTLKEDLLEGGGIGGWRIFIISS